MLPLRLRPVLCAAAVVIALAGCSRSVTENVIEDAAERETNQDIEVDSREDGTVRVETDEGVFTTGNALPENWPKDVPVYADADILFAGASNPVTGAAGFGASLVVPDGAEAVWAFYDRVLAENGWTVNARVQGGDTSLLGAKKDERSLTVMIGSAGEQTTVTIGIEEGRQ